MKKLKIYGSPRSRTIRVLWMAHELKLEYEHIPTAIARLPEPTATEYFAPGETHTPEFLELNPNGRIPVIDDGGTVVWESMAINLYLAIRYGRGSLWSANPAHQGHCLQWSFWAVTELEGPLMRYLLHTAFLPETKQNPELARTAEVELRRSLKILDQHLANSEYLLGSEFSAADLNLASVLSWIRMAAFDLSELPNVGTWLRRCTDRPAYLKTAAMMRN
ncbi:MAG: glutathione S-transferase family protein [Pseudomonadales bacterium]|nr:glutathione S-transferase family protein [Pseudomonadales bacterium]